MMMKKRAGMTKTTTKSSENPPEGHPRALPRFSEQLGLSILMGSASAPQAGHKKMTSAVPWEVWGRSHHPLRMCSSNVSVDPRAKP